MTSMKGNYESIACVGVGHIQRWWIGIIDKKHDTERCKITTANALFVIGHPF